MSDLTEKKSPEYVRGLAHMERELLTTRVDAVRMADWYSKVFKIDVALIQPDNTVEEYRLCRDEDFNINMGLRIHRVKYLGPAVVRYYRTYNDTPVYQLVWPDDKAEFAFVRLSEIATETAERLMRWMTGQTMPIIETLPGETCIYFEDYIRFVRGLPIID